MKLRLFLALFPTESITSYLGCVIRDLQDRGPDIVTWVKAEGIHITLKFLGEVNKDLVGSICEMVCGCVSYKTEFGLRLDSLTILPRLSTPRVICVGLTGDLDGLSDLQSSLEQGLISLGCFGSGLELKPHITLGRIRRTASSFDKKIMLSNLRQVTLLGDKDLAIREVAVVRSTLTLQGPKYSVIYAAQLGGETEGF